MAGTLNEVLGNDIWTAECERPEKCWAPVQTTLRELTTLPDFLASGE